MSYDFNKTLDLSLDKAIAARYMINPMKTDSIRFIPRYSAAAGSLLLLLNAAIAGAASGEKRYVGAKRCGTCHAREYGEWKHSGHARILRKSSDPAVGNIPLPAGYTRKSIPYVVGGFRWKNRETAEPLFPAYLRVLQCRQTGYFPTRLLRS